MFQKLWLEGCSSWAAGRLNRDTVEASAMLNANALGKMEVYQSFIDMDYETYVGVMHE